MPVEVKTFQSVEDARRALQAGRGARLYGGGTLLMLAVNAGVQSLETLVRLTDPALREVRMEGDRVTIGAGVTMAQVAANRDLAFLHPVARVIGGPGVRSAATVGGNLFARPPYGDFATALLALGATVQFAGAGGQGVPIDEFLRDRGRDHTRIVRAVSVPVPANGALRFVKVTRVKPTGVALMSIAAHLPRGGRGEPRIAFGNMGPTPLRATAAERALAGGSLDEASVARAAEAACEGLQPATDAVASEWYRREVAPVQLKRLLRQG